LPGAFYRAPDKEILCRVPGLETPGKERPPANQPLRVPGTQQIPAVGKNWSLLGAGHSAKYGRWQKVAGLTAASGRQPLPGFTPLGTRQIIFLIFFKFLFKFLCRVPHDLAPGKGFFAGCPGWHPTNFFLFF
jgi:hypothetical protein